MSLQKLIDVVCKLACFFDRLFYVTYGHKGQKDVQVNPSNPYERPRVAKFMSKFILCVVSLPSFVLIPSIIYNYYAKGPLKKSWSLEHSLFITMFRKTFDRFRHLTVEQVQLMTTTSSPAISDDIICEPFTIPLKCREAASDIVSKQFSTSDREKVDWNLRVDCEKLPDLKGEWLQDKSTSANLSTDSTLLFFHGGAYYFGSYKTYRGFLEKIARGSKKRTCAIDYRLSPQHPFPSALEDAMAAYLYLIDPPKDSGAIPIDPKKIVLSGDSCGGGLAISLLIAIRDSGLPLPSGAVVISPLLDLTYSLPSVVENIESDFLPEKGHWHVPSPASNYIQGLKINEYNEKNDNTGISSKESISVDNIHGIENDFSRVQYYIPNVGIKLPLVSPAFDKKDLHGLPKILIQCGDGERLRDESIYATLKGTGHFQDDEKKKKIDKPSQMILELYEDQPHDFPFVVKNKLSNRAIKNAIDFFVSNTTLTDESVYLTEEPLVISKITPDGKLTDIKDKFLAKFTKEKWNEWEYLLSRISIKDRVDFVNKQFGLCFNE